MTSSQQKAKINLLDVDNIAVHEYVLSGFKNLKTDSNIQIQLAPQSVMMFGASPCTFLIYPQQDFITDAYINIVLSPITGTVGAGTYAAYVNSFENMIQRIEYSVNGVLLKTDYGTQGNLQPIRYLSTDINYAATECLLIGDTTYPGAYANPLTQRSTLATANQQMLFKLNFLHNTPFPCFLLGNTPVQVNVYMQPVNKCIQSNWSTATGSIVSCWANIEYATSKPVRDYVWGLYKAGNMKLHYHDTTQLLFQQPSGSQSYVMQLTSAYQKHVDEFIYTLNNSADLASGLSTNPDNWQPLGGVGSANIYQYAFDLKKGSIYLIENFSVTDFYNRYLEIPFVWQFPGAANFTTSKYMYCSSFADKDGEKSGYSGSYYVDSNDLQLTIYFATAPVAAVTLNCMAITSEILVFSNGGCLKL